MDASPADSKNTRWSSSSSPPDEAAGASAETPPRRAEKEADDEQVERFYALLANIRALRGAFGTSATTTGRRKRGRREEPPWRPAFRMEDFEFETEEVASGSAAEAGRRKKRNRGCGCARTMPAGSETGAVESGNDDKEGAAGHVLEPNGPGADAARVDQLAALE